MDKKKHTKRHACLLVLLFNFNYYLKKNHHVTKTILIKIGPIHTNRFNQGVLGGPIIMIKDQKYI